MATLTKPQAELLERVTREGKVVLNGRARRTVEALERAELVTTAYWLVMQGKGGGVEFVERFAVAPAGAVWIDCSCKACGAVNATPVMPPENEPLGEFFGPCQSCQRKYRFTL